MAAAVPQRVREFNAQVSKAQLTLEFLDAMDQHLQQLHKAMRSWQALPSEGAKQRTQRSLTQLQSHWAQRYAHTLGSLDDCLAWSPVYRARKQFHIVGWSASSLHAQSASDQELVSFCLMGQEGAHGAWMPQEGRSHFASQHMLAAALAPLQMQVHPAQATVQGNAPLLFSVEERTWAQFATRFMVRGNGKRFPAGQWVTPQLRLMPDCIQPELWSWDATQAMGVLQQVPVIRQKLEAVRAQVQQFCADAGQSLVQRDDVHLQQMQAFTVSFSEASQAPVYAWVSAVIPAVRLISKRRVARLLKTTGALE